MQTTAITRTNLITNPSFEVDTTGWTTFSGTITRVTSDKYVGSASAQLTTTGANGCLISNTMNTVSGTLYSLQARVKGTVGDTIFLQGYNAGTSQNGYVQITADGTWQLINTVLNCQTSTVQLEVGLTVSGHNLLVDAVLMETGPSFQSYFDGSFGTGYTWSGTANNSISYYRQFVASSVASARKVSTGILISWDKTTNSSTSYFTIGTSSIGGSDIIKSAGGVPAFADQYNYGDYTSYAVNWSTTMRLGQYPYGMVSRQADVTLNNASNLFTPASGTSLGPNIRTGRPVKISVGFNNETIGQFVGYSDSPVFDKSTNTTQLHCYDVIDYLNSYISQTTPTQLSQRADQIIQALLEEAGFASSQFSLEISLQRPIAVLSPQGQTIGTIIQKLCEAEAAIFFADENGIMHFWNRQHFANQTTPIATFTYSNTENFQEQDAPIINAVEVKATPLTFGTDQKIWEYSSPIYLPAIGPNGSNLIANPSFETTTSGWTGSFLRVNTGYIGSHSASGTNMTYDISSALQMLSNGGYRATAQCFIKAGVGQQYTVKFNGSPLGGTSITGVPSKTMTGNGTWQNVSLDASNYSLSLSPGLPSWTNAGNLPSSSYGDTYDSGFATYNGYVYVNQSNSKNVAYAKLNQGRVGQFFQATPPPTNVGVENLAAYNGYLYLHPAGKKVFVAPINADGSLGSWTQTATMTTYHESAAFVAYHGYMYCIGGYASDGQTTLTTVEFAKINGDGTLGTWTTSTALPAGRGEFGWFVNNGYIYVSGGITGDYTHTYFATLNASTGAVGTWTSTTDPGSLYSSSNDVCTMVYLGGYVYLATTDDNDAPAIIYSAVNASNGTLGTWTRTSASTTARFDGALVTSNGYLYQLGGYDVHGNLQTSIISNAPTAGGVTFQVTAASAVLLDCISSDITNGYYDGDTTDTSLTTYSWNGTVGNSTSQAVSIPTPVSVQASFSNPVLSIDLPVSSTSGINTSYYITNGKSDGSGASLGNSILVSSAQVNGDSATVIFANNSTTQGYITDLVLWGQAAVPGQVIVQTEFNQTSINQYRLNPANNGQILEINNDYIQDSSSAQGLAFSLVNGYSTPAAKYTTDVFALPQIQFGDLVSFVNRETGETLNLFVTGITNSLGTGGNFKQTLILERKVLSTYFTIGTSAIGGTDQISP